MSFLANNWEYVLLCLYILEKGIKLSPSKKDDLIWDMVLKPIVNKLKEKIGK
mgnify:FL=1|tara:strand:+ start:226 stop:381 length:156 start_codon:yes stop_codon:yes gene_type:complete